MNKRYIIKAIVLLMIIFIPEMALCSSGKISKNAHAITSTKPFSVTAELTKFDEADLCTIPNSIKAGFAITKTGLNNNSNKKFATNLDITLTNCKNTVLSVTVEFDSVNGALTGSDHYSLNPDSTSTGLAIRIYKDKVNINNIIKAGKLTTFETPSHTAEIKLKFLIYVLQIKHTSTMGTIDIDIPYTITFN